MSANANNDHETIDLTLKVWRQRSQGAPGQFETHEMKGVSVHSSFLEMLDVLNSTLVADGKEPVVFDHDCREGICGMCGMMVNGRAHGGQDGTTICQVHMRSFKDGDHVYIEPWRARAFKVMKDLVMDRGVLDRLIEAGGFVSTNAGSAPEANSTPVSWRQILRPL